MAKLVQVELRTPNEESDSHTHTVMWVAADLKPTQGMILSCKGDPRSWEVMRAYTQIVLEEQNFNNGWKVGGLK